MDELLMFLLGMALGSLGVLLGVLRAIIGTDRTEQGYRRR